MPVLHARPPPRTCHFRVFLTLSPTRSLTFPWRADQGSTSSPLLKSIRRLAFLGLKTNLQNYHGSEIWDLRSRPISLLLCQYQYLLQSGAVYMEMEFGEWYVEVEFAMVYHVSQNIVSVRCQARNANSVVFWAFLSLGINMSSLPLKWRSDKRSQPLKG